MRGAEEFFETVVGVFCAPHQGAGATSGWEADEKRCWGRTEFVELP